MIISITEYNCAIRNYIRNAWMIENRLKSKLRSGEPAIGVFVRMGAISVEIFGRTGWDFVIIDMEHGVHTMEDVSNLVRAARSAGLSPIVRTPGFAPIHVMRSLDAGADGVQIPQVEAIEDIRAAVAAARYHPLGNRGACGYSAATGYSTIPFGDHIATSNEEVLVVVHIENKASAEMIDEILGIEGIDVLFFGPWDISQSLGIPGQVKDPRVIGLIDGALESCRARGMKTGIFVEKPEFIKQWLEKGVTYLTCTVDVGMLADASKALAEGMRGQVALARQG